MFAEIQGYVQSVGAIGGPERQFSIISVQVLDFLMMQKRGKRHSSNSP